MTSALTSYLTARPDSATFLVPSNVDRALEEIFPRAEQLLPEPYRIYPADETQPPSLGFPVAETTIIRELDSRLDRWLADEVAWQVSRQTDAREKAQLTFTAYTTQLIKAAENALVSNLLNDYHAIFWLAHSFDVAKQFSSVPRRISMIDTQVGRTQGDTLKYRIFGRWATETRDQLTQVATRVAPILDGEEQRGLQFFRLLQENVLILSEEFIGADLRELRSFITGYLRRDFQSFRDTLERFRTAATDMLQRDRMFRAAIPMFGANPDHGITVALMLDPRFQAFLFDVPAIQNAISREDREQFQLITKRVREFVVLNQLRRGIVWMVSTPDGEVLSADRRSGVAFSRSTRPLDFGKPGIVDPMVHRFGLIYDISAFSETLGNIRRGGRKEEVSSYRQMVLFQRRLESIAERHSLQFEKFLGDGAFYTTRRAIRLVRAAVEIQRFYAEMRRKRFAFKKGLRIALNFGYYRLLPMKTSSETNERITEFYGPGIIELSRLTTGKANKEIEEIASFLVAHGFELQKVQEFFAPLARGVDMVDHEQSAREFYSYVDASGHLVNEGIVAAMPFLQELSAELMNETAPLHRLRAPWGTYIGFAPAIPELEFVGARLLGMVSLKGLDDLEIGELVPFTSGETEAEPLDPGESLAALLRQNFHQERERPPEPASEHQTTGDRHVGPEIVVCVNTVAEGDDDQVVIAEWDPHSDDLMKPLRMPLSDFKRLFSMKGGLTVDGLTTRRRNVRDIYRRLTQNSITEAVPLSAYRTAEYERYVLGDVVERM